MKCQTEDCSKTVKSDPASKEEARIAGWFFSCGKKGFCPYHVPPSVRELQKPKR